MIWVKLVFPGGAWDDMIRWAIERNKSGDSTRVGYRKDEGYKDKVKEVTGEWT